MYDLGEYGARIVIDDSQFTQGMSSAEQKLSSTDNKAQGFGKNLGALAVGAVAGLGVALVGAGAAGMKMAMDLDSSLNKLQMQTGATDEEMKSMEESMKNIYNANLGESFDDIAQSMASVNQVTGQSGQALESLTKDALLLRDTFEFDVVESTRAADSMMKNFGISGDEAMNLIAQGAQQGLDKNGDLLDTLNEYSPQFAAIGLSAEDALNLMATSAENGAFSVDKIGDSIKEMNIKMKDGNEDTISALKTLGLNADEVTTSFAEGGEKGKQAFHDVMQALAGVEDPMLKNQLGVALMGTMYEDLEAGAVDAMANIGTSIDSNVDALGKINEIKYTSFGEAMEGLKRNFQTALIEPIQQHVLPLLSQFSTWIMEHMPQIQAIMSTVFGGIGAVIGTVIDVVQSVIAKFQESETSTNTSFTNIQTTISTILETIKGIITDVTTVIKQVWQTYGDDLVKFATTAWESISQVISGVLKVIQGIINTVLGVLTGDWERAWNGIKQILSGVWDAIKGVVELALNTVKGVIDAALKIISNIFKTIWEGIKSAVSTVVSAIVDTVKTKFEEMKNNVSEKFNNIKTKASEIWNNIKTTISNFISEAVTTVKTKIETMKSNVSTTFSNIVTTAQTKFNEIKSKITEPIESAKTAVGTAIEKIKGFFSGMKLSFPKISMPKLPHFKLNGSFSLNPPSVPKLSVDWYKTGGFFDQASIVGIGEAGREAILPLENKRYMAPFADAVFERIQDRMMNSNNVNQSTTTQEIVMNNSISFNVNGSMSKADMDKASSYMFKNMEKGMRERGLKF